MDKATQGNLLCKFYILNVWQPKNNQCSLLYVCVCCDLSAKQSRLGPVDRRPGSFQFKSQSPHSAASINEPFLVCQKHTLAYTQETDFWSWIIVLSRCGMMLREPTDTLSAFSAAYAYRHSLARRCTIMSLKQKGEVRVS